MLLKPSQSLQSLKSHLCLFSMSLFFFSYNLSNIRLTLTLTTNITLQTLKLTFYGRKIFLHM